MSNQHNRIRVGITQGDPNGIGPEVILRMLDDPRITDLCTPVVYASGEAVRHYRKGFHPRTEEEGTELRTVESAEDVRPGDAWLVNTDKFRPEPGVASAEAGASALAALECAVRDLREGNIDVLLTAPIDKHSIQSPTFSFPGHTEYLEASLGETDEDGNADRALMIMATADGLRIALATAHIPITEVGTTLTRELILDKLEAFDSSLKRDFGVVAPRIAVLSLNPHAGEQGLLGTQEQTVISPAIEAAREENILAFGPYPSDGFFGAGHWRRFDGVLAMYHDQGLAPFKTMAMDAGVNFTAGLPYVRTSPDHGTGYDIAGKGEASEASIRNALYMALDIYRARQNYDHAHRNPLRKHYHPKGKDSE